MVDEKNARAGVDDVAETGAELHAFLRVEAGRRLIHAEKLGTSRQRSRRRNELALTLTDLVGLLLRQITDPEHVHRDFDALAVSTAAGHDDVEQEVLRGLLVGRHEQVLFDGEVVEELE